ncbi:MAG: anhydro-N-acetylmuramic acid kinase, partial [Sediminibacterium sp.]
ANMALILLAEQSGHPFDANGEMARRGVVNIELLEKLNSLSYYSQELPKSLGKEWFERHFLPLLGASQLTIRDLLATCTEHMAIQIAKIFEGWTGSVLVTGGGAFNEFLIGSIQAKTDLSVVVPDTDTVQYKEALIFALLGALRLSEQPTALSEVTGAYKDTCGGCIYL